MFHGSCLFTSSLFVPSFQAWTKEVRLKEGSGKGRGLWNLAGRPRPHTHDTCGAWLTSIALY